MTAPLAPLSQLAARLHPEVAHHHPVPAPQHWQPLAGGRSNLCWGLPEMGASQVATATGHDASVAERPATDARTFPVTPQHSKDADLKGAAPRQATEAAEGCLRADRERSCSEGPNAFHTSPSLVPALVLKLYRPQTASALFPNDPGAEGALLQALRGHALAPAPLAQGQGASGPWLLYRHLPGPTGAGDPAELGALLRRLHDLPPPRFALRTIDTVPAALRRAIRADLPAAPARDTPLQAQLREGLDRLPPPAPCPPARRALLHGDPVPGNLVQTPDGLRLIDWQCPGMGDPCHDLALALSPAMAQLYGGARPDPAALLAAYGRPEVTARFHALAPLLHLRIAVYCAARAADGSACDAGAAEAEMAALTTAIP